MTFPASEWLGPLPASNWSATARQIDGIVDHTIVGTIESATSRFRNPNSIVSATFGIGLSGRLVLWVRPQYIAYHAGNWPINVSRLGFEHEDEGRYWDAERTPELYMASAALHRAAADDYGFPLDDAHVGPHKRFNATACPDALDIPRIIALAEGEAVYWTREEQQAYMNEVASSFKAVKDLLNPIATWVFDAPNRPMGSKEGMRKAMRVLELAAKPPKLPKRFSQRLTRPAGAPSRDAVLAGHGRGVTR